MDDPSADVPGTAITALMTVQTVEPPEAEEARTGLEIHYSDDLPRLVSMWLMSKRSAHTRRAYARSFRNWAAFCRSLDTHPMAARRPHADAYMRSLEASGVPSTSVAHALSTASSFYRYAISVETTDRNPFADVDRPTVDPDHSATEGLTEKETASLIAAARELSPRAYALVLLLYTLGLRVDGALSADVSSLGYDRGHRTLTITKKGGATAKLPLPPITVDALDGYLTGRTEGPLFITRTGARLREPEVWKMLRRLAKRAGLPQADTIHPHVLRHGFITDALDQGVPLHLVQDAAGHKDPRTTQRYNRARRRLDGHPAYAVAASMAGRLDHRDEES
ncbi:tyrosine-type recombinase/integrase [Streptomyces sp. CA-288835]|uniref:tyrosine-type recombinase/integrase n=1 Tax=Streptomyces sp. CA-288835 TaxID=3240069 RepID=UPI003D8A2CCD